MSASIRYFTAIWLAYFLCVAVLPAELIYPNFAIANILHAVFAISVAGLAATFGPPPSRRLHPRQHWMGEREAKFVVVIGIALAFIGLVALTYDKLLIQSIDYSQGLASAREQWRRAGVERQGISSPFSVIGYLLSTGYVVSLTVMLIELESIPKWLLRVSIATIVVLLLANSALVGGRSTVLLVGVFAVSAYCIRLELSASPIRLSRNGWLTLIGIILLCVAYVLYIFAARAEHDEWDWTWYAISNLYHLGGRPTHWLSSLDHNSIVDSVLALAVLSMAYIVHSAYSFAAILDAPSEPAIILFGAIGNLIAKLGLISPPDADWFLAGRFASVPAALYHDFGELGFVAGAILLGGAWAFARHVLKAYPRSIVGVSGTVCLYAILLLTPVAPAIDFLSFPFIAAEFVLISFLGRISNTPSIATQSKMSGRRD